MNNEHRIEYHHLDKSEWVKGPWQDEPDKIQWYDEDTDLPCLIVRQPSLGHLCGYVGVRPGHPWHGKDYDNVGLYEPQPEGYDENWYLDVHGGLTFAGPCNPAETPETGICHTPREGDTDDIWWLGFDCAHAGDQSCLVLPDTFERVFEDETYRDVNYVTAEVAKLAKQAQQSATRSTRRKKVPKSKKPKTLTIHMVLDRSGSMGSCRESTITAVNDYIKQVAKDAPDSTFSLTIFDDRSVDLIRDDEPITKVKPIEQGEFEPRGMTPLYDAIGQVTGKLDDATGDHKALVIVTDGHENCSRTFDAKQIKSMLDDRQEHENWLVIYLGANQDAIIEGQKFGARAATAMSYGTANMAQTMTATARSTVSYASTGKLSHAAFTDEERDKALSDE